VLVGGQPPKETLPRKIARRPARPKANFAQWEPESLVTRYEHHPARFGLWWDYAPTLEPETIAAYRLGVGILPKGSSKCFHERLIVPLIVDGTVVGMRTRSLGCDCGANWLSPLGSRMILYNGRRLEASSDLGNCDGERPVRDNVLFITENPIDALLLEQKYAHVCAVATLGVSMWRETWTPLVKAAKPLVTIVAYDNDWAGNVTAEHREAITTAWRGKANRAWAPMPEQGNKLVERLQSAGIRTELFPWGQDPSMPIGADLGDLLRNPLTSTV